jgi:hypothetical protein
MWGLVDVYGDLVQDLAALQNIELLPWGWYGLATDKSGIGETALKTYRNYDSGGGHVLEISFDPPLPAVDHLANGVDSTICSLEPFIQRATTVPLLSIGVLIRPNGRGRIRCAAPCFSRMASLPIWRFDR